jgi:multidrug efflux pump subunit AcrA (membrane-fusion protein)
MKWALIALAALVLAGCETAGAEAQRPDIEPGVRVTGTVGVGVTGSL